MPYQAATKHLKKADPRLAKVIAQVGPCTLQAQEPIGSVFEHLTRAIVFQQLSGKAASTIHGRFLALYKGKPHPTPEDVLATPVETMRGAGLSGQKSAYLLDLSRHCLDGLPKLEDLHKLDDDTIVKELTRVKGVGRWTVEMLLMFRLGRMDVWPVDDLGIRAGLKRLHGLEAYPKPKDAVAMGDPWRPYRTVAAWYLWQSLEIKTP